MRDAATSSSPYLVPPESPNCDALYHLAFLQPNAGDQASPQPPGRPACRALDPACAGSRATRGSPSRRQYGNRPRTGPEQVFQARRDDNAPAALPTHRYPACENGGSNSARPRRRRELSPRRRTSRLCSRDFSRPVAAGGGSKQEREQAMNKSSTSAPATNDTGTSSAQAEPVSSRCMTGVHDDAPGGNRWTWD